MQRSEVERAVLNWTIAELRRAESLLNPNSREIVAGREAEAVRARIDLLRIGTKLISAEAGDRRSARGAR